MQTSSEKTKPEVGITKTKLTGNATQKIIANLRSKQHLKAKLSGRLHPTPTATHINEQNVSSIEPTRYNVSNPDLEEQISVPADADFDVNVGSSNGASKTLNANSETLHTISRGLTFNLETEKNSGASFENDYSENLM